MKKRALVAGGAGFIGSHLVDALMMSGRDVTVVDNLITGRQSNISSSIARGMRFVNADINEDKTLGVVSMRGAFHEIYNMASPASPVDFAKMPVFIMDTAARGHRNLLELARRDNARIFFASTSEVYGDPLEHPQRETYFGNVNPIGVRSCYDEAKRYGEALSYSFHRQHRVDVRVGRIFNTYGPRMRPDDGRIIPNFFIQALQKQALTVYGEGKQTRSFCYVADLCAGIIKIMESTTNTPINIGNPIERTVSEIAERVNALCANTVALKHLPLPENDPKQRKPDISKAIEVLNWEPKVTLEEGLEICLKYFREELARLGEIETPNV